VPESIRFFMDQHIPAAVTQGLRDRGVDVLTAQDAGRCSLPDGQQLQFASAEQRVMVTFDSDYLALYAAGTRHAGIAWCQERKYTVGQLLHRLLLVHGILSSDDMRNHVEYL
jgi:predicted nuclease of predicted toxin-antitoxin system